MLGPSRLGFKTGVTRRSKPLAGPGGVDLARPGKRFQFRRPESEVPARPFEVFVKPSVRKLDIRSDYEPLKALKQPGRDVCGS